MAEREEKIIVVGSGKLADEAVRVMTRTHPGKKVLVVGDDLMGGVEDRKLIIEAMKDFRPERDLPKIELGVVKSFGVELSGREKRTKRRKKPGSKFSDLVRSKLK